MEKLTVNGSRGVYPIYIGNKLRFSLETFFQKEYSSIFILTDEHVYDLYLTDFTQNLTYKHVHYDVLKPGEQTKDIHTFSYLHTRALEFGLDRDSLIVALGGGVIGDIAGFVAATFMRGIDYIQVPTTLLAHDSSIGGKVAINHEHAKNIIGAFYPPTAVVYDTETLHTLPAKEIRSGYAELVKEALIRDRDFFDTLLKTSIQLVPTKEMTKHIYQGITIKSNIVEHDEHDHGQRNFLNFGHTFGHALETVSGLGSITHGEAVAIGMLFAIYVSEKTFLTKLPYNDLKKWMENNHFPLTLEAISPDRLYKQMAYDKKASGSHINMVLLKNIGEPLLYPFDEKTLKKHINYFIADLTCRTF